MTNEQSLNSQARQTAQARVMPPHNLAPATVSFSTQGHLLITGSEDMIRLAADQLDSNQQSNQQQSMASITLLCTEAIQNTDNSHIEAALTAAPTLLTYQAQLEAVKGFLGQFQVTIRHQEQTVELAKMAQNRATFDLILNLGKESLFSTELAPAGYFHISPDADNLSEVIQQLPEYIGEFEKPRYFQVNQDLCAHSNRGQTGCTRCLDVCPADAISSIRDLINIDPHICHGAGGCTTACPTGAISYALPQPVRMQNYIQQLLDRYQQAGGKQPAILFHDHEQGREIVNQILPQLPGNLIPVELEELAAAGQDIWLTALACGASHITLLDTPAVPESMRSLLQREIELTRTILSGLGYGASRINLLQQPELSQNLVAALNQQYAGQQIETQPAASAENKKDRLYSALNHLITYAPQPLADYLTLPAGSPFGLVTVDQSSCTLCLSCVAVCPTQSLTSGGEKPALNFTEQSCVQCNLCERACPENAIQLESRLLLTDTRKQTVEIHADEAFACITCSKPFAPRSTVEKMIEKLSGHRLFEGPAINRLKMCEDCRVTDIYADLTQHPEKQLEL